MTVEPPLNDKTYILDKDLADRAISWVRMQNAIAPNKPMMIGETSSTELNGSKAAWITDALNVQMPQSFPKMKAFVWFNVNADNMDWPVESSASAQAAFKGGITSSYYGFNEAFGMEQSPIPPLYP